MSESKSATRIKNNLFDHIPQKPISTMYVNPTNNLGLFEDVQSDDRYISLGSNVGFSSQVSYRFGKNEHFLHNIAIIFGITYAKNGDSPTTGNQNLSDYVAYKLIDRMRIQLGSSQPWNISGSTLLHLSLQQCDTMEKRRKLLEMSGIAVLKATAAVTQITSSTADITKYYIAHIPIYGSTLRARTYDSVKPLPLHMIKADNLELTFNLSKKDEVFKDGDKSNVSITSCNLYYQFSKTLNSDMLRKAVYNYPFTFTDDFESTINGTNSFTIDLQGFRRAECTHIIFYFVTKTSIDAKRQFDGARGIKNIQWYFNGDKIREEKNLNSLAYDLYDSKLPNEHGDRLIRLAPGKHSPVNRYATTVDADNIAGGIYVYGSSDTDADAQNKKYYHVLKLADLLKDSQTNGVNNYTNGCDFSKQALQLRFESDLVLQGGKMYYTMCYNSLIRFSKEGMLQVM